MQHGRLNLSGACRTSNWQQGLTRGILGRYLSVSPLIVVPYRLGADAPVRMTVIRNMRCYRPQTAKEREHEIRFEGKWKGP